MQNSKWNSLKFLCTDQSPDSDVLLKQDSARKYLATSNQKIWIFVLPRSSDISASSEPFPARIRVSGSPENPWSTVRAKSRRVNRSAARACKSEAATSISNESLLQATGGATPWISRLILSPSSRGFVFPDRADALNRRPGSNLLRHAGLSGRIWIWASSAAGGAQRHLWISCHRLALFD